MLARRNEFYALRHGKNFPLEHKIHTLSPPCNILYLILFSEVRELTWPKKIKFWEIINFTLPFILNDPKKNSSNNWPHQMHQISKMLPPKIPKVTKIYLKMYFMGLISRIFQEIKWPIWGILLVSLRKLPDNPGVLACKLCTISSVYTTWGQKWHIQIKKAVVNCLVEIFVAFRRSLYTFYLILFLLTADFLLSPFCLRFWQNNIA